MANNYEFERLHNEIENAKNDIAKISETLRFYKSRRDSIKEQISAVKYRIDDYKRLIQNEYDAAHYCYQMHDRYGVENHKYTAQSYKNAIQSERSTLNMYFTELSSMKSEYEFALAELREAKERKQRAYDNLNNLRETEKMYWREKPCKLCGRAIRYRTDWAHIPNVCKDCKRK